MVAAGEKAERGSETAAPVVGEEVREARVREHAYAIREREGCPEGAAERHWLPAEAELREPAPPAPGELDMTVMGNILP
jgi:hypothetical protein